MFFQFMILPFAPCTTQLSTARIALLTWAALMVDGHLQRTTEETTSPQWLDVSDVSRLRVVQLLGVKSSNANTTQ